MQHGPADDGVITAGVVRGLLRHRLPLPRDLVRLGFMPQLVERVGSLLRLVSLAPASLSRVLRAGLRDQVAEFAALGYELRITVEAFGRVARAVVEGSLHEGSRRAVNLLASAAQARLLGLLHTEAPSGTMVVLTPDDLPRAALAHARP